MNSDEKEIPRYYDFNYLLRPAPRMIQEECDILLDRFVPDNSDRKSMVIDCAINAYAIHGDSIYDKDVSFAANVPTEAIMEATKASLMGISSIKDLKEQIRAKMGHSPTIDMNYKRLYDFEIFLLRQKAQRLTKKNKSV